MNGWEFITLGELLNTQIDLETEILRLRAALRLAVMTAAQGLPMPEEVTELLLEE